MTKATGLHLLLSTAMTAMLMPQALEAQSKVYFYKDSDDNYLSGTLCRVSPDGRWAVGFDGAYETGSFIIDTEHPTEWTLVEGGELYDVTNDGVCVGARYTVLYSDGTPVNYAHAGIYHDGEWTMLKEPEECAGRSWAVAITRDGKRIGGHAFCSSAGDAGSQYFPIVWDLDEATGEYLPTLFNEIDVPDNVGFYVRDMSDDGSVIVGEVYAYAGSAVPAMLRDGQLTLWNEMEWKEWPFEYGGNTYYFDCAFIDGIQEGAEESYWFRGSLAYIHGNYAFGHRSVATDVDRETATGTVTHYASVYNLSTGQWLDSQTDGLFTCGSDLEHIFFTTGARCGYICEGDEWWIEDYFDLYPELTPAAVYGFDDAGRVLVGSALNYNEVTGEYEESPALYILSEEIVPSTVSSETLTYDFALTMGEGVTAENLDGGTLESNVYDHVDSNASWMLGKTSSSNRSVVAPTRNADKSVRRSRITFPAKMVTPRDIIRWQARSMHSHLLDCYRIMARADGDSEWTEIAVIENENYRWTTRGVSLEKWAGKAVEVAIETLTPGGEGFMLALDNVSIGEPKEEFFTCEVDAPSYIVVGQTAKINVTLTNYGPASDWTKLVVAYPSGTTCEAALSSLSTLESVTSTFEVELEEPGSLDYTILLGRPNGDLERLTDVNGVDTHYVVASAYERCVLLDHFTGTWCNTCPTADLKVASYQRMLGHQMLHVRAHVNDNLTNAEYWDDYGQDFIFSIPALALNHNKSSLSTETFEAEMREPTIAWIDLTAKMDEEGQVAMVSNVKLAEDTDNTTDRYRVGYMLLATINELYDTNLSQRNAAYSESYEEYYYQPSYILPKMMWYENVIVEGSTATNGVAESLGSSIVADETMTHSYQLTFPEAYRQSAPIAVAMVIDTQTGRVLNVAYKSLTAANSESTVSPEPGTYESLQRFVVIFPEATSVTLYEYATQSQMPQLYSVDDAGEVIAQCGVANTFIIPDPEAEFEDPSELITESNIITVTVNQEVTRPGRYMLRLPAETISVDGEPLEEDINYYYTIENEQSTIQWAYSLTPSLEQEVVDPEKFTITFSGVSKIERDRNAFYRPLLYVLDADGERTGEYYNLTYVSDVCSFDMNLSYPVEQTGLYELNIPDGYVSLYSETNSELFTTNNVISEIYHITSSASITNIEADSANGSATYYDLQGRPVEITKASSGVYIKKGTNKVEKVWIKR